MRTYSLDFHHHRIHDVTVDLTLVPGLPSLQLIGDISQKLKECAPKLKAALLNQGFTWPRTRQVVVDVRSPQGPAGRSVELAILAALLRSTGQIPTNEEPETRFVGELSLDGAVSTPAWLNAHILEMDLSLVLSGPESGCRFVTYLQELVAPTAALNFASEFPWERPRQSELSFSTKVARMMSVVAAGEHHSLFAGPPGSGKTTLVSAIHRLLEDLEPKRRQEIRRAHLLAGDDPPIWRPLVSPHHSSSALALLGGSMPPQPGELSRAHGGLLFLDEYLQFNTRVQEALREPLERGAIRLARGPMATVFPCDFLLIAATNLCPCGHLTPARQRACPMSLWRCRSHADRLSGPMLDRFQLMSFSHQWKGPREVSVNEILSRVQLALATRTKRGQSLPNGKVSIHDLQRDWPMSVDAGWPQWEGSERRREALLRVARTCADLDGSKDIGFEHISQAMELAVNPYLELTHLFA